MKKIFLLLIIISSFDLIAQCGDIKKTVDKFTGNTLFRTPYARYYFSWTKAWYENDTTIYLSLNTTGSTLNYERGVIILLEDGTKIEWPDQKLDVKSGDYGWQYSALIEVNQDEIKQILASPITDYRLYIYPGSFREKHKKLLQDYLNCIIQAK